MAMENNEKIQKRYRIVGMDLDDEELKSKIREYKQAADDGVVELPSWPDFVARAGLTEAVCAEVMQRAGDGPTSAYYIRGRALGDLWQWCRGQYMSNPNWGATAARVNKAMMLYKMMPDGAERAKPAAVQARQGPAEVIIRFGGGDDRAKNAGD